MNAVIAWFAHNRVAANLLMLLIAVAGLLAMQNTKKTILPDFHLDMVMVTIPYPGASPSEVEEALVWRVESSLASLSGIQSIDSFAYENRAVIRCVVSFGSDPREIKESIKAQLDALSGGFPAHAGTPRVKLVALSREPVATVVISGPADQTALKALAQSVKNDLLDTKSITQVDISNVQKPELSIEVSELAMQRYGLSFSELATAIKQQSVNISAGVIRDKVGNTSIRTVGQAYSAAQYEELVIRSLPSGGRVLLKDVAQVEDSLTEAKTESEYNGEPAVFLYIYRAGHQSILEIAKTLRKYVANPKSYIPDMIRLDVSQDISSYFKNRVDLLIENGASGLGLLFIVLMLFLRLKLSFWVSIGIPISFLGAFCVLPIFDASFNMVSLFAFILVLGIVVDDAIIVGENIFTQMRRGNVGVNGAIAGAQEVAKPVVYAVVTTMIMFAPLLFLPGPEGQLMRVVPLVVIAVLAFSLVESLLILPAHLAPIQSLESSKRNPIGRMQERFSLGLERFIDLYFRPFLETVLRWRYPVTALFVVMFILTVLVMNSGWLKMVFFSTIEADYSVASVSFAKGTSKQVTRNAVDQIEAAAVALRQELMDEFGGDQVLGITAHYGSSKQRVGDHLGSVLLEMAPSEGRNISGDEINRRWRALVGEIPDALTFSLDSTLNKPGPSIDFEITGTEFGPLEAATKALKEHLAEYDGVYGIRDTSEKGKPELRLRLNPLAHDIGLVASDMATQVRQAFHGVDIQTLQRGQDQVNVVLRYPSDQRQSLWFLENMHIRLPSGERVPLSMVADVEYTLGPSLIRHVDQRRAVRVQAYVDESQASTRHISRQIRENFMSSIEENYHGVKWLYSGMQKHEKQFIDYLKASVLLAFIMMYMLMAVLFRSYLQPLIIMYAIPFGVVGAIGGHLLMDIDVTLWSVIGMTAVSGVVVNDNLVLVDYINRCRAQGESLVSAIRKASAARFRPIVLTSVTTFCGLVPLMLEKSVQAQFLIPMAVSLSFGVIFATVISLILVPATYHIMDDMAYMQKRLTRRLLGASKPNKRGALYLDYCSENPSAVTSYRQNRKKD